MPTRSETRDVPFSAEQMFDLVADVARYPEFLPWCAAARIRSRRQEGAREIMEADLVISFKVFRERFGSRVILDREELRIDTEYLDGPFRYLQSYWQFTPREDGCTIHFHVDFEFRSKVLQAAIGLVFDEAMQRIVRAFESRAQALYG